MPFKGKYFAQNEAWWKNRDAYGRLTKAKPMDNALAIRSLQRQINKQKPEVQHYFVNSTLSVSPTAFNSHNISPCESLAAAVDRDERVLGDSWINKSLELRFTGEDSEWGFPGKVRLIVYVPKKAGTTISFSNITQCIDPNQMTVLHDELVKPYHEGSNNGSNRYSPVWAFARRVSLGNRKSTFIGTTPEKNNIRVLLLTEGNDNSGIALTWSYSYKLSYTNI